MGEMGMPAPANSIPMLGAPGKYGYIDMGGMFTILKVRDNLTTYDDPAGMKIRRGLSPIWRAKRKCNAIWADERGDW